MCLSDLGLILRKRFHSYSWRALCLFVVHTVCPCMLSLEPGFCYYKVTSSTCLIKVLKVHVTSQKRKDSHTAWTVPPAYHRNSLWAFFFTLGARKLHPQVTGTPTEWSYCHWFFSGFIFIEETPSEPTVWCDTDRSPICLTSFTSKLHIVYIWDFIKFQQNSLQFYVILRTIN